MDTWSPMALEWSPPDGDLLARRGPHERDSCCGAQLSALSLSQPPAKSPHISRISARTVASRIDGQVPENAPMIGR